MESKILKIAQTIFEKVEDFKRTDKLIQYKAKSKNRISDKETLIKELNNHGYNFTETAVGGSSVQPIQYKLDGITYRFWFKPISGGMTETTLNSTITELIPAIMFNDNITDTNTIDLYAKILECNISSTSFVNDKDKKAGMDFIYQMVDSSKFDEKFENAMAIYDYISDVSIEKPIDKVYWTYRAKPVGIADNSPADIVLQFQDSEYLGVSIKAGGLSTKEPLLNTYVNKVFQFFDIDINTLDADLYELSYKELGLPRDYKKCKQTLAVLMKLENENPNRYNELYDRNLLYLKKRLMNAIEMNNKRFIEFIKKSILKEDDNIQIVIVKAINREYNIIEDDNKLLKILPLILKINLEDSEKSKQNFYVNLHTKENIYKMMFSIRSNKPGVKHKLGQYYNLAIKYNGLK